MDISVSILIGVEVFLLISFLRARKKRKNCKQFFLQKIQEEIVDSLALFNFRDNFSQIISKKDFPKKTEREIKKMVASIHPGIVLPYLEKNSLEIIPLVIRFYKPKSKKVCLLKGIMLSFHQLRFYLTLAESNIDDTVHLFEIFLQVRKISALLFLRVNKMNSTFDLWR